METRDKQDERVVTPPPLTFHSPIPHLPRPVSSLAQDMVAKARLASQTNGAHAAPTATSAASAAQSAPALSAGRPALQPNVAQKVASFTQKVAASLHGPPAASSSSASPAGKLAAGQMQQQLQGAVAVEGLAKGDGGRGAVRGVVVRSVSSGSLPGGGKRGKSKGLPPEAWAIVAGGGVFLLGLALRAVTQGNR